MTPKHILQINFLIVAFGLVLYSIYFLNRNGLPTTFEDLMGLPPKDMVVGKEFELKWCPSTAKNVSAQGNVKLVMKDYEWSQISPSELKLNFVAVEQWFTEYCFVPAKLVRYVVNKELPAVSQQFSEVLRIEFSNGISETVAKGANNQILVGNFLIESSKLQEGLAAFVPTNWVAK